MRLTSSPSPQYCERLSGMSAWHAEISGNIHDLFYLPTLYFAECLFNMGAYRVRVTLDILPFYADIQQAWQEKHAAIIPGRQIRPGSLLGSVRMTAVPGRQAR